MKETSLLTKPLRSVLCCVNHLLRRSAKDHAQATHERHHTPTIDPDEDPVDEHDKQKTGPE